MEKLKMHTPDLTQDNIAKILELFPNCVSEARDEQGNLKLSVDFDQLRQELSNQIVEGPQERYRLDWPGKREALFTANAPIAKTLRPAREESVDFENTKNLFIEGDNLDSLKLLQETYLGKIKVIYLDPPYNTGKDFVYEDDFAENHEVFFKRSNQKDEKGNRLVANMESNGRYHSDWLSMINPRLKLSRNLLDDDGVIFVSINDKETHNLRKIMDEIYGADNFIACLIWDKNHSAQAGTFKVYHEYVHVYAKNIDQIGVPSSENNGLFEAGAMKRESSRHPMTEFNFPAGVRFEAPEGFELTGSWGGTEKVELISGRMICENKKTKEAVTLRAAFTQKNQMQQFFYGDKETLVDSRGQKITDFYFTASGKIKIVKERGVETPQTTLKDYGSQGSISTDLADLFDINQTPIDNPKPVGMMKDFIRWFSSEEDIVLDFFSGSGTTAHAVIQLNSEEGGKRQFIMVQLPEECNENSTAFKAGYKTIAEVGKERIRRAGKKILEGECHENWNKDIGFRVLKVDSSNMADVYYTPDTVEQKDLISAIDNIKPGRDNPEDLLFQVMLDWGVDLTLPISKKTIQGKTILFVDENALIACFDNDITEDLVKELAGFKPLRIVFKDNGFVSDAVKINVEQIFKQLSPGTDVKSI
ncbi:MAG: site-specific DNA-methyltransferase [Nitrospira sp.]|nr:site-specific DNA-methyltransferase [Nitrospira sp.]